MSPSFSSPSDHWLTCRRRFVQMIRACAAAPVLLACSPETPAFKSTDVTGASFAKDLRLKDHHGNLRTMKDFKGKIVVVFFGYTQCPNVCPTSMSTMAEVKRLLGTQGDLLQVLFITVDPERDTQPLLKAYIGVLSRNRRKFRQPINVACPAPGRWGRPNSRVTSRHFDHGNASRTSRPDCSGLDEAD